MSYTSVLIFSFTLAISAVIGLVRFKKINRAYHPFLFLIWLGLFNEILGVILARIFHDNSISTNIYLLAESVLITWQFRRWGLFDNAKPLYVFIVILLIAGWLTELIFVAGLKGIPFYFEIAYAFIIVLMSIHTINGLLIRERRIVLKNPIFLICLGFVIYYTLKVLDHSFWLYGLSESPEFSRSITNALNYVNLLANLIYALAVLWMPTRHRFSMPS